MLRNNSRTTRNVLLRWSNDRKKLSSRGNLFKGLFLMWEPTTSKKTFFFFNQDDERLKEGQGMFCRSVRLQDQREAWEKKRTSLREERRKKHRDAKRRQRPSLKT